MIKILSVLIGVVLSAQMISAVSLGASAKSDTPPKQLFTVSPSELSMTEGETCQLTVTVGPEFADSASVYLYSSNSKSVVSNDGTVTAYSCGEDHILIEVSYPDDKSDTGRSVQSQSVKIHVQPDETLPAETRSELDRLQIRSPFGDFQRKTLELLRILNADAPRITAEQMDAILNGDSSSEERIAEINRIHGYPDYIWRGDPGFCEYWLDENGNDKIQIVGKAMFFRVKNYDDGTVKEVTTLYPPELLSENIGSALVCSDSVYLEFNQFPLDYHNPVRGDANQDGICNLADAFSLEAWLGSVPESNMTGWEMADFNQDGQLNAIDLTLMKRSLHEQSSVSHRHTANSAIASENHIHSGSPRR